MKSKCIVLFITALTCAAYSFGQSTSGTIDQRAYVTASGESIAIKRIKLDTGVELEYAEQGAPDGIPVIFLHGITDSWHSFESSLLQLPASIHAFAITQRGHGNSEKPLSGYHPKNFAADIAAFVQQQKLGSAFIAGHSMGGIHAQQFVLDYPELTRGIIIIDSDPAFSDNEGMADFMDEVARMDGAIDSKYMDAFQRSTLAKPIDAAYYRLLVNEGLKVPVRVFKAALTGLLEVDYAPRFADINKPVLILWGEKDAFCDKQSQETFRYGIKNSRLIIYPNTGHALHWEEPQKFAGDLVNFIDNNNKESKK